MKQWRVFAVAVLFCSALSTAMLLTARSPIAATAKISTASLRQPDPSTRSAVINELSWSR